MANVSFFTLLKDLHDRKFSSLDHRLPRGALHEKCKAAAELCRVFEKWALNQLGINEKSGCDVDADEADAAGKAGLTDGWQTAGRRASDSRTIQQPFDGYLDRLF